MLAPVARGTAVAVALISLVAVPALAAEVIGTSGDDVLVGTAEADTISGGGGADQLLGGDGADAMRGGSGADELRGEAGRDSLKGDKGADRLFGGIDDDRLVGGNGADLLVGEAGDDVLLGEDGADVLRGAAGYDGLYPEDGDRAFGGADADTFSVYDEHGALGVVARGGEGDDRFEGGGEAALTFFGGPGDDQAVTSTALSGLSTLHGGAGDDYLRGWASMDGGDGADILESEAAGADVTLAGGDGDDQVYAAQAYEPTVSHVSCGAGVDTAFLDLADALPDDCEDVNYEINGTDRGDTIEGTPYDDFVRPFDGADTVRTFGGDDFVNGGNDTGGDVFFFGAGDDSIRQQDGNVDIIHCGPGYDRVTADDTDIVDDDCEFIGDFDF